MHTLHEILFELNLYYINIFLGKAQIFFALFNIRLLLYFSLFLFYDLFFL